MELVTTDNNVTEINPEPSTTTTRTLTITVKVTEDTADLAAIKASLEAFGEVAGISYYEQTYTSNQSDAGYVY